MQTYDLTLNLQGNAMFAVPRYGVLAAEVLVLKALHGPDAIAEIEESTDAPEIAGEKDSTIRAWLAEKYGKAMGGAELTITSIFGPDHLALPKSIEGATKSSKPAKPARTPKTAKPDLAAVIDTPADNTPDEPAGLDSENVVE